ncbi:MAG: cytochrome B6 [Thermoanaerobaculia bacterium]
MRSVRKSLFILLPLLLAAAVLLGQEPEKKRDQPEDARAKFEATLKKMSAEKPAIMAAARAHLAERYDLSDRPAAGVTMTRGKAVQEGVRVKLPSGVTWQQLAALSPEEIRRRNLWPLGFMPLPHANHPEGGMLFPQFHIDEVKRQTDRDLTRFDLDFEVPDRFLPEFPPAIFLTTRPDLGDVSQGKLLTSENFYDVLGHLLNPKQIEGLRLLVAPFPQQQFNQTEDRRSVRPSLGVTCFDCHVNGHTNAANHLVGDIRPQEFRHRIETPSLRGVFIQRLFGSQRALKSVEDFTEFEQRAAYFDGDHMLAAKKGVNPLERGSQVHFMSEMEALLDFPPAPKLGVDGQLDPAKATAQEMRGQQVFFGKAQCGSCHPAPYYTDNSMHDLQTGRFFEPRMIRDHMAVTDGKIKTFPLRGIKESPPYMHDGRLMTLDDTVEFFNLILQTKLTDQEKKDLVAFMRAL